MVKSTYLMVAMMLLVISGSISYYICQYQLHAPGWEWGVDNGNFQMCRQDESIDKLKMQTQVSYEESELDQEIRRVMEMGGNMKERKRQIPAIETSFARRTEPQRARFLSALCYLKTLGTPFMPIDIAEIALAETGSHGLSGKASSPKGAIGVWQLMPSRAKSHGYSPKEMENDQKCADAAVRELANKLAMAKGNLEKAKKLYCGVGKEADAYEHKRRQFRREIMGNMVENKTRKDEIVQFNEHPKQLQAKLIVF